MAIIGNIAKKTLSTTPYGPAASAIFGAVVHLIQAAQKVTKAYDWIERALGQLQCDTQTDLLCFLRMVH